MTLRYVNLPLFPDADYGYSIALEGNSYNLQFTYNERMELYTISLFDEDSNPIVLGEGLVPYYPIFRDYALLNLSGWIWLEEIADNISEAYKVYPDKLDEYYQMYYVYDDGL